MKITIYVKLDGTLTVTDTNGYDDIKCIECREPSTGDFYE